MSDDKKSDDYRVDMPSGKEFRAPSPLQRASTSHRGSAGSITENPVAAILAYCGSSILMTVTNKYVLSGYHFNLNFFLLIVQSVVCVVTIEVCKRMRIINYRDFNMDEARKCTCLLNITIPRGCLYDFLLKIDRSLILLDVRGFDIVKNID